VIIVIVGNKNQINNSFHMACLSPPKLEVPKDAWYCDECTENQKLLEEKEKDKAKT
jgi:hypothetical protein